MTDSKVQHRPHVRTVKASPGHPTTTSILGASPGIDGHKVQLAALRALRTLLQGLAAALPAAGIGSAMLSSSYWATVGYSCLAALVTAGASFLHNVASFLPDDPTQTTANQTTPAGTTS